MFEGLTRFHVPAHQAPLIGRDGCVLVSLLEKDPASAVHQDHGCHYGCSVGHAASIPSRASASWRTGDFSPRLELGDPAEPCRAVAVAADDAPELADSPEPEKQTDHGVLPLRHRLNRLGRLKRLRQQPEFSHKRLTTGRQSAAASRERRPGSTTPSAARSAPSRSARTDWKARGRNEGCCLNGEHRLSRLSRPEGCSGCGGTGWPGPSTS